MCKYHSLYVASWELINYILFVCTGENIPIPEDNDQKMPGDRPEQPVGTNYNLRGIVVHSGQASGGHYYSFIRMRYSQ